MAESNLDLWVLFHMGVKGQIQVKDYSRTPHTLSNGSNDAQVVDKRLMI